MSKPITHQIADTAIALLKKHPSGLRTSELNRLIKETHPDFHPKTINGVVWLLHEKQANVIKPERGLYKLK